jgi:hypothetical protein
VWFPHFARRALACHLLAGTRRLDNAQIDRLLGLEVKATSQKVGAMLTRETTWGKEHVWQEPGETGHPMTSYSDLTALLSHLNLPSGSVFSELGAGFGRAGLVVGLLYPQLRYLGYELVSPRVEAAHNAHKTMRLDDRVRFQAVNMAEWEPTIDEDADVYYVFCSFREETGRHVLEQLRQIAERRTFRLVLNLGMFGFEPQETPWLVHERDLGIFTLYQSR